MSQVKTSLTEAQKVIKTYPSFTEIFEYALNNIGGLKGGMTHRFYTTLPEHYRWEAVSDLVDLMVEQTMQRPFHKSYSIEVNKNTGFSSVPSGGAIVYDFSKKEYKVNGDEYLALLKIMATSWMHYPIDENMYDTQMEFQASSLDIYSILD